MYVRFGLDLLMAVTFVLFFNKQVLGGLTFHEIAGLAIAVAFFTHVLLNWQWVKKVTVKLFDRRLPRRTKFGYFLNIRRWFRLSSVTNSQPSSPAWFKTVCICSSIDGLLFPLKYLYTLYSLPFAA